MTKNDEEGPVLMMDHFKEEIVVRRDTLPFDILYIVAWVLLVCFGLAAIMMFQFLFAAFSVQALLLFALSAGVAVLIFLFKDYLKMDYEYTFTNGMLDFARVFRNASRKELGSMNVQNVLACGHVAHQSFQRYLSKPGVQKKNWFLNRDGNLFYFYYEKGDGKHLIVIEPSEELVEMIRQYAAVGSYQG